MRLAGWEGGREVRGCALNSAGKMSANGSGRCLGRKPGRVLWGPHVTCQIICICLDPSVRVCISLLREMRVL